MIFGDEKWPHVLHRINGAASPEWPKNERIPDVGFPRFRNKTGKAASGPDVAIALVMGTPGGLTHVGWEADSQPLIMLFSYK